MGFDLTTFVFELVNFGLLLWILQRILYRPLRAGIERRRKEIALEHERAASGQRAAEELRVEAEKRLAEIEKVRETIIADAREQAAKEEARILEHARQDADAERDRVQRTLERERKDALSWIREATVDNASEIAGRLLQELLPDTANDILAEALVASLVENRDTLQLGDAALATADGNLVVELRAPRPLSKVVLEKLREAVANSGVGPHEWVVREDESLVAGPVLRIGDHVLDASVAGSLEIVRKRARELVRDGDGDD